MIYSNFIFLKKCPLDGLRILKCVIYVRYVDVFGLVEIDICYLQFGFLYVDVGWYIFGRVCYVVIYQCDDALSCFVASILSRGCVVVELKCFVWFLKFCFL